MLRAGDPRAGAHRRHARRPSARRCAGTPPHILVTTPESLYLLLTSASGREMLVDRAHGDRRRNPRRRADQARRAPGAHAGAAGRQRRAAHAAHRPVRDAEAHRGSRAVPGGRAVPGRDFRVRQTGRPRVPRELRTSPPALHADRQQRSRARARHQPGDAGGAARSGDVGRGLGDGLRPARAAHRGASHHAGVREHAPHGRARVAASGRAPRRGERRGAPRQPRRRKPASTPSSVSRPASSR